MQFLSPHPCLSLLPPLLLVLGGAGGTWGDISTFFDPGEDRWLELYPDEGGAGEPTTLYWGEERLNGAWGSVRQSGVWVLYSEAGYVGDNVTVIFGEDTHMNIRHPIGSARYVGNSRAKTLPALTLYSLPWYRGREYVIEAGPDEEWVMIPNFRDFGTTAQSLIGIGQDWTLFSGRNFLGPNCTCVQLTHFSMSSYDGDDAMLAATFHPYLTPTAAPPMSNAWLSPVGSAIMTCEVPMKKLCARVPWDRRHRATCPAMSLGVDLCA